MTTRSAASGHKVFSVITFLFKCSKICDDHICSHIVADRKYQWIWITSGTLQWSHNDHDCVSNHQPHDCLLNRLFRRRSKKTSKLRVTGLCVGNSPGPVNSPHKGPVTRKMFPFDDVIMSSQRNGLLNDHIRDSTWMATRLISLTFQAAF